MINTSYFSSKKYDFNSGVSVARFVKFKVADTCPELYPPKDLLSWWKELTNEQQKSPFYQNLYAKAYKIQVLNKLDVHKLSARLQGKVLLCYEKSDDFCHRHIIANWFKENGYECEEL